MDNLFLYVSIVLLILLLICIIFTIRTSLDNKKLKRAANKSSISNQDLRDCVNMLIRDTNFDIYMYDDSCKTHYIMKDNEFTPSGLSLADIESLIHPDDKKRYQNEYKEIINYKREHFITSLRLHEPEHEKYCYYEYLIYPTVIDEVNQKVVKYIYLRKNVTRQNENLLTQQDTIKSLNLALASANLLRWQYDIEDETFTIIDSNFKELKLSKQSFRKCILPSNYEIFINHLQEVSHSDNDHGVTIRIRFPEQFIYKPYEMHSLVRRDETGKATSIYGILKDVSEVLNYQRELTEKIEFLEAIRNYMPTGMLFYDKQGDLISVNDSIGNIFGIDQNKLFDLKLNFLNLSYVPKHIVSSMRLGKTDQYQLTYDDIYSTIKDTIIPSKSHGYMFDVKCTPVKSKQGETIGYITMHNDITEISKAQRRNKELKESLFIALDAGGMVAWIYDTSKQTYQTIFNNHTEEVKTSFDKLTKIVHPEDLYLITSTTEKILSKKISKASVDFRVVKNNTVKWYRSNFALSGTSNYVISGTSKDITDEITAKENLEKLNKTLEASHNKLITSSNRLNEILDNIPIPICLKNAKTREYVYCNVETAKQYNIIPGTKIEDYATAAFAAATNRQEDAVLRSNIESADEETIELKNGHFIDTFVKKSPITIDGVKHLLIVRVDITAQNNAVLTKSLLAKSFPALKAFTWTLNISKNTMSFGEMFLPENQQICIQKLEYMNDYIRCIHPEDREQYRKDFYDFINSSSNDKIFIYRADIEQDGNYEWWQSRTIIENIDKNNEKRKHVYGIDININSQKLKDFEELKL